jgi:hypothetical protein
LTKEYKAHNLGRMSAEITEPEKNFTEKRYSFEEFTYKDALAVLTNWHATMRPGSKPFTGDFQLRLDSEEVHSDDWLCLDTRQEQGNLVFLREIRNGFIKPIASEISLSLVKEVVIKIDSKNSENSELTFESENLNYSISNGGLKHILTNKEGVQILERNLKL